MHFGLLHPIGNSNSQLVPLPVRFLVFSMHTLFSPQQKGETIEPVGMQPTQVRMRRFLGAIPESDRWSHLKESSIKSISTARSLNGPAQDGDSVAIRRGTTHRVTSYHSPPHTESPFNLPCRICCYATASIGMNFQWVHALSSLKELSHAHGARVNLSRRCFSTQPIESEFAPWKFP